MFELKGAKPGEAGMRPLIHIPDGSSYKQAKPYAIPAGAYQDMESTPPCEIRLGSQGRGIWVKPELPNEYVPRSGMCSFILWFADRLTPSSRCCHDTTLPSCYGPDDALPWKALFRMPRRTTKGQGTYEVSTMPSHLLL